MMPSALDASVLEARCTLTSGDVGFEVKIYEGKRAICCSLYGGGRVGGPS